MQGPYYVLGLFVRRYIRASVRPYLDGGILCLSTSSFFLDLPTSAFCTRLGRLFDVKMDSVASAHSLMHRTC